MISRVPYILVGTRGDGLYKTFLFFNPIFLLLLKILFTFPMLRALQRDQVFCFVQKSRFIGKQRNHTSLLLLYFKFSLRMTYRKDKKNHIF